MDLVARVACDGHRSTLFMVTKMTVAAALPDSSPTIRFDDLDDCTYLGAAKR